MLEEDSDKYEHLASMEDQEVVREIQENIAFLSGCEDKGFTADFPGGSVILTMHFVVNDQPVDSYGTGATIIQAAQDIFDRVVAVRRDLDKGYSAEVLAKPQLH